MDILTTDVEQITQWGLEAGYVEVCGVLLTRSDGGPRLKRVPNKAVNPQIQVFMDSDDFMDALLDLVEDPKTYSGNISSELVVWHTHPGGLVGPSDLDRAWREELSTTRCLVVTIPSGEAVTF
jgi:proteasome lid subunit RPN8/RPN11